MPADSFANVPVNTYARCSASPQQPNLAWTGLVIAAPVRIVIPPADKPFIVPVCAMYRLPATAPSGKPPKLVVAERSAGRTFEGFMPLPAPPSIPDEPDPNPEPVDPSMLKDMTVDGYFNADAASVVNLPRRAAVYTIHAEYRGAISAPLTVEVVATPK